MAATVRIIGSGNGIVAFVTIVGEHVETRVRWTPPCSWRCDACGAQDVPTCRHARAVANSTTYAVEAERSDHADTTTTR